MHSANFRRLLWGTGTIVISFLFLISPSIASLAQNSSAPIQPQSQTQGTNDSQAAPAGNQQNTQQPSSDSGQQPVAQPGDNSGDQGMFVFRKQVEEVVLHATVVDAQHRPVPYLPKTAFNVYENGIPQTITSFRREDVPVAMGIVIDNSGSMRNKRQKVNDAVMNLIQASNPNDEIFIVNFSNQYYLDQDFTSNPNLLEAALHQVTMEGSTALYDAIAASAVHLDRSARLEKKVLLVITDGEDNMSEDTLAQAARHLQSQNGPTLYAIGLTGSGLSGQGRQALQQLADLTGGVAYFPSSLSEVNDITREIAHDVRSQYIIAYRPNRQGAAPSFTALHVTAQAPGYGPLTVRTQTGFFSGSNKK